MLGAISQPVFGVVVLVAVATTLIGPTLINIAFSAPVACSYPVAEPRR